MTRRRRTGSPPGQPFPGRFKETSRTRHSLLAGRAALGLLAALALVSPAAAHDREHRGRLATSSAVADANLGLLTIRGVNFGGPRPRVTLAGETLSVLSSGPFEILAALPAGREPGSYRLTVSGSRGELPRRPGPPGGGGFPAAARCDRPLRLHARPFRHRRSCPAATLGLIGAVHLGTVQQATIHFGCQSGPGPACPSTIGPSDVVASEVSYGASQVERVRWLGPTP